MTIQGEPLVRFDWIGNNLGLIGERLWEHIFLTVLAVGLGLAISFGLSLAIRWNGRLYLPITSIAGVLYTIPSLALFALLVPFTGLSILTAEIGLVSYTLLILTRNIVGGLEGVPADAREAAIGMGYTARQLLLRVELPLALPVIIAGVRVATVTTIGLVTVTALIGQGGLGQFILQGIQRFFYTPLVVGAVLSIALAIAADALLVGLQRAVAPWTAVKR
ncbi:MAG: glycine/betaine ABC transporter permease [Dehalococcoidia bacterium]|jgi:osmoprotectant transport system permease protein|nr:MAG: glycine/betaine ABC transporter permease [Dehalococcoidia bacterium]